MRRRPELIARARSMRHSGPDAEMRIWSRLRGRRLSGWKFRRQYATCGFILDFYCPEARLAVELDGGGHAMREQAAYDEERARRLSERGIRVLRFWDDQALKETDAVLEVIVRELECSQPPHPSLSPKGERAGKGRAGNPLSLQGRGERVRVPSRERC